MVLRTLLDNILRQQPASAARARERLQIVLAYDRSNLDPELLNQIRREIFEVVSRYMEVNPDEGYVSLETEDDVIVLVANLPIRRTLPGISTAQIHN